MGALPYIPSSHDAGKHSRLSPVTTPRPLSNLLDASSYWIAHKQSIPSIHSPGLPTGYQIGQMSDLPSLQAAERTWPMETKSRNGMSGPPSVGAFTNGDFVTEHTRSASNLGTDPQQQQKQQQASCLLFLFLSPRIKNFGTPGEHKEGVPPILCRRGGSKKTLCHELQALVVPCSWTADELNK